MPNGHADTVHGLPFEGGAVAAEPARQAYQLLHFAFAVAPIIAGVDKFLHVLVNWDQIFGALDREPIADRWS
jgi:hypothetical protein